MTLEAGKEMDRCCVINWLNEVYVTPSRAFNEYTEDELKMFAYDALVLLKEQEPVEPKVEPGLVSAFKVYSCGHCDTVFLLWRQKYCSNCGKKVKWE